MKRFSGCSWTGARQPSVSWSICDSCESPTWRWEVDLTWAETQELQQRALTSWPTCTNMSEEPWCVHCHELHQRYSRFKTRIGSVCLTKRHRAHELVFGSVGLSRVTFHFEFNWIKKLKPLQCFCPDGSETSTEHRNSLNLRIHLMKHVCINVVSGVRISSELKESAEEQLLLHRPPCSAWRERRGLFSWLQTVTNRIIRGLLSKCILIQLLISCISSELYSNLFHGTSAGSAR